MIIDSLLSVILHPELDSLWKHEGIKANHFTKEMKIGRKKRILKKQKKIFY